MNDLSFSEFRDALERHGAQLERWPAPLRASAQRLLAQSEAARGELHAWTTLDTLLDAEANDASAVSPVLRAKVLDAALSHARAVRAASDTARRDRTSREPAGVVASLRELWLALGGLRLAGPAFAAALVLGSTLGLSLGDVDASADEDDLGEFTQLTSEYPDF